MEQKIKSAPPQNLGTNRGKQMTREEQRRINIEQAAKRAKAEAEARATAQTEASLPKEVGGRNGPEPTRFGDWELKGITSDF